MPILVQEFKTGFRQDYEAHRGGEGVRFWRCPHHNPEKWYRRRDQMCPECLEPWEAKKKLEKAEAKEAVRAKKKAAREFAKQERLAARQSAHARKLESRRQEKDDAELASRDPEAWASRRLARRGA